MPPVLIIGAAQAGLAAAYHLQQQGIACTLVDAHARIGDSWRTRWDSLRLFSPAKYSSLPGMAFPADPMHLPTKDEVGDYLEEYARRFQFAVRLKTHVEALKRTPEGYALELRDNVEPLLAPAVIVATGAYATPFIPQFAHPAATELVQSHVAHYHRPADLPDGPALVVGTGASGTQIAAELSATRKVYLSGPNVGHLPTRFLGKSIYWWLYTLGLPYVKRDSWIGRWYLHSHGTDAIIGKSLRQIVKENGLIRRQKLVDFENGLPVFADGQRANDIRSIVWATGYRNDYSWIQLPIFDDKGQPIHRRGVVKDAPGLYFMGLKFLYQGHSSNLGGVDEDGEYIAQHIANCML